MRLIWATDDEARNYLIQWAGSLIPHVGEFGGFDRPCQCGGVLNDAGNLRAVIIFHDWQPQAGTLQVSCASSSPHWASPGILREVLFYAFQTNGSRKLWMAIPSTSPNVIDFNKHLGFRYDAVLREHFGEKQDAIILSMMADEYRKSRWFIDVYQPQIRVEN